MSLENSKNIYTLPFLKETKISEIAYDVISHVGPFEGAVDLVVPLETSVLAPLDGKVVEAVDTNDKYGPSNEYVDYANYITLLHVNEEYSQMVHLEKNSIKVKVGDRVVKGQELALTGNSGWMTEPHLHLIVFKLAKSEAGFQGLKIKFDEF